jgi:hypothetical protein
MNRTAAPRRRRNVERPLSVLRTRVARAFRDMAQAVDAATAQRQALAFYRASGMPWASRLI